MDRKHGCTVPDCGEPITHDLILFQRYKTSKCVKRHVYLCERHAEDMDRFLKTYEGDDYEND